MDRLGCTKAFCHWDVNPTNIIIEANTGRYYTVASLESAPRKQIYTFILPVFVKIRGELAAIFANNFEFR